MVPFTNGISVGDVTIRIRSIVYISRQYVRNIAEKNDEIWRQSQVLQCRHGLDQRNASPPALLRRMLPFPNPSIRKEREEGGTTLTYNSLMSIFLVAVCFGEMTLWCRAGAGPLFNRSLSYSSALLLCHSRQRFSSPIRFLIGAEGARRTRPNAQAEAVA